MAKKKNSLVNNINKRKKAGKSRPKSRSTVSKESYSEMKKGWPKSHRSRTSAGRKKGGKSRARTSGHAKTKSTSSGGRKKSGGRK